MKNAFRLMAVVLSLFLLCLSLCGCDALDEARKNHAVFNENGNILHGGIEYKLLPKCATLAPLSFNDEYDIYVTEKDVPVLLSTILGESCIRSDDGKFLTIIDFNGDYENNENIYCQLEYYDEIENRIKLGNMLKGYCYSYMVYYEETYESYTKFYQFSDIEVTAIERVLSTVEGYVMPSISSLNYDFSVEIEMCSEDLLFRKTAFDICGAGDQLYVVEYMDEDTMLYEVPDELKTVFDGILKAYMEEDGQYYSEY